jgi:hypothetical protein
MRYLKGELYMSIAIKLYIFKKQLERCYFPDILARAAGENAGGSAGCCPDTVLCSSILLKEARYVG